MRIWAVAALAVGIGGGGAARAQDDCFRKVVQFSEGICAEFVRLEGGEESYDLQGELNAKLNGFFKVISDVGGEFGGSLNKEAYSNILREDIPVALEAGRACRLEVAKSFYDKICGASTEQTKAPMDPFSKTALIEDPDGWTNVRSGAGTDFQAFTQILDGEKFQTFVQDTPWWQVQLGYGRIGYVHSSRIRLIE